ncbi:Uncharacterised protein [Vibrio cholerae]|uniref:Uncharacterized protein n=1 Tax=Vibrio cholerae TaxID=666 RepID=A0A656A1Q2_VIBCL|nr:Uncharacterised protein [Vibrio cholerae]CSB87047.1 Uncharacterised protein [Vibrio cholerae]CSC91714.1 Uncharacterised protein [Vibrio cholerae]CSD04886.1 Uncharacterised protein [Vibrio cholerae]
MARLFRFDVRNEDEVRQQFFACVIDWEIFLVTFHGVHQSFCWNFEEFFFKFRRHHHWPFHQRGHFFYQRIFQIRDTAELLSRLL